MHSQACRRLPRPGKSDAVMTSQMIEQVADASADELHRAFGQYLRLDYPTRNELGQIGGRRCGLNNDRHSGEDRWGQFLEHAPDREIKRIDMHGRAFTGNVNMLADEAAAFGESFYGPVQANTAVRQFA